MNDADPETITDLDRLSVPLLKAGWTVRPRYFESPAVLRIFSSDLPVLGESVGVATVEPGPANRWYRASTGALLAPCSDPSGAARKITEMLCPMVSAAMDEGPTPTLVAQMGKRFPDVPCWWGLYTLRWWAVVRTNGTLRLVSAPTVDVLARIISDSHGR